MSKRLSIALLVSLFGSLVGFDTLLHYTSLQQPESWPEPSYDFSRNPLSEEGIALGRALFYDPILSADSSIACDNCHLSYTAFTHVDHALSHGINDSIGTRNSPALMNLAWSTSFMWDGAINHLDMQPLAPIAHPAEMGSDINDVVKRLSSSLTYPTRFSQVFGSDEITGERVLKALAQFQVTLISANSKYDLVNRGETTFNEQEKRGYDLFQTHCEVCHREPLFTSGRTASIGLPIDPILQDLGRMAITQNPSDSLHFKVPSLRNVEYSRPYMHDGRFQKLSEVLDHYSDDVRFGPSLSLEIDGPLNLNNEEKIDLTAFLLTLSDKEFLFNPDHAYPRK